MALNTSAINWATRTRSITRLLRGRMANSGSPLGSSSSLVDDRPSNSPKLPRTSSPGIFSGHRFKSSSTASQLAQLYSSDDEDFQDLDFPGGKVGYVSDLKFISGSNGKKVPCYRVLDNDGELIRGSHFKQISEEAAVKMYEGMATLQVMDTFFYEAQRQGRISFYMTATGEEAVNLASAAALSADDVIFAQYREPGVLLWRGFTLQECANQLFGNKDDYGKGRQMPVHYGSNKHNYFTISSPLATQLSQAVGAAYSLKMENKDACTVAFTGDGATSEGDFHAALNFAAVMDAPMIFICRNNGWAISTHTSEQFRSDGVVVKGQAYGIKSIRVDGNDAVAVYSAVREAREMAIAEQKPVLIEAMTYRVGHHSTSDDSTKYRSANDIEYWKMDRNPVNRFRKWIEQNGWWTDNDETELRSSLKKQVLQAIQVAEKTEKPSIKELFLDVYDKPTSNLQEQERQLRETIKRHSQDYPANVPF